MLDIHYVAGIIDGEGYIGFNYTAKTGALVVNIAVSMTNPIVPELLCQQFGGHIVYVKEKQKNHKDAIRWGIKADKACVFLELIKDLLLIKSNQALLALYYNQVKASTDNETRLVFKKLMHKLNRVGTNHGSEDTLTKDE